MCGEVNISSFVLATTTSVPLDFPSWCLAGYSLCVTILVTSTSHANRSLTTLPYRSQVQVEGSSKGAESPASQANGFVRRDRWRDQTASCIIRWSMKTWFRNLWSSWSDGTGSRLTHPSSNTMRSGNRLLERSSLGQNLPSFAADEVLVDIGKERGLTRWNMFCS